jgi:putative ABC transport system ATP-binding protein
MTADNITLQDVTKKFTTGPTQVNAVSHVSISIPRGSFRVLAGTSGSGKTTLLNLIGGLTRPTTGKIMIGDQDLTEMDEQALAIFRRHQVGFIFQGNNLISTLTSFENIEIPLILTQAADRRAKVEAILKEVGLLHKQQMFPHYLSVGEQQRIAIARAVVHSPEIVLADEPTANIDSKASEEILLLLQTLNQKLNRTILFSTHDPKIIEQNEKVIWLRDGEITEGSEGPRVPGAKGG